MHWKTLTFSVLLLAVVGSCSSVIYGPYAPGMQGVDGEKFYPTNDYTGSIDYCFRMERGAYKRSRKFIAAGVLASIGAAVATGAATVLAVDDKPTDPKRRTMAAMPLVGTALSGVAALTFSRAKDSSKLASAATLGMTLDDEAARAKACSEALAAWHSDRIAATSGYETQSRKELEAEVARLRGYGADAGVGDAGPGGDEDDTQNSLMPTGIDGGVTH